MMGKVIPFPRVRNRPWIGRHARRMAEISHEAAEKHLRRHLETISETLRGMRITAEVAADHSYSAECDIRSELLQWVLTPRGAA